MKKKKNLAPVLYLLINMLFVNSLGFSQDNTLNSLQWSPDSSTIAEVGVSNQFILLPRHTPIVSFVVNDQRYAFNDVNSNTSEGRIKISIPGFTATTTGIKGEILFENSSADTIRLKNVVPFGEAANHTYITGLGNHELSRTHLFLPGKMPVNIIVPDNAWDLGYCSFALDDGRFIAALMRRDRSSIKKGTRSRFETSLFPGGSVKYLFYAEVVQGNWQAALTRIFQERMLYDVETFDNGLFERKDLQWIRHSYVIHMMMTWNKSFYDYNKKQFNLIRFIEDGKKLYGGDDAIALWPTWPTLGLDQRNQFDLFKELPGGTKQLKKLALQSRSKNSRIFVCYNPWDESTRNENHFSGITDLIEQTGADGVVLDTKGESSTELQQAADKVRKGVIMYSEGMAVPKDMQGIVSGRVHNALYYPPMLNLNKLIKPEFAIFRVTEINKEPVKREFSVAFFNGYGTEINVMPPGNPEWLQEQYKYLGRTAMILRENSANFVSRGYTPLLPTTADSIWVNRWVAGSKTLYTVYSIIPQGYTGNLFEVQRKEAYHFVDLWHHKLVEPAAEQNRSFIEVKTSSFDKSALGTNNEGAVDCIAQLPVLIKASLNGDELMIETNAAESATIKITAGNPAYDKPCVMVKPGKQKLRISETFGRFEGKFVIQVLRNGELLDETIVQIKPGTPRRISSIQKTALTNAAPAGMVQIPSGQFTFHETHGDEFISYPLQDVDSSFQMPAFYMDRFPVTNKEFATFLTATKYQPSELENFLRHWKNKKVPAGMAQLPVVYISYEDARAYAKWAGKRLPTEIEWQYAAQTSTLLEWPWGQSKQANRAEQAITNTLTTVNNPEFDSSKSNPGNGVLDPVGKYPAGANPFGLQDLVGSVWQLTNDLYISGSYNYILMKGGSYFKPANSWWYVQGGPRPLHYRQYLLRVSQGFERNATVGFRCVKDALQP